MIPERLKALTSFIVMDVLEKAHEMEKTGINVIHLEVGEPDFDTPGCIKDAVRNALDRSQTHYTHSMGIPELRVAICNHYRKEYGVCFDPDQVAVTSGSSPAILMVLSVLLNPNDGVVLSDPYYACYPNFIRFLNGEVQLVAVNEEDGFQFQPEMIRQQITENTRAIMINSPSNPTGAVLSQGCLQAIAGLGPWIISDEIYHGLVYGEKAHSILEYTDHAFVVGGFSKLYAMTGLRLGYLIVPKPFIRAVQILQQNFFICANAAVQEAGIAALEKAGDDVERMKEVYNQRRMLMVRRLRTMGFGITADPAGAFYVFANAAHISKDSFNLAFDILEKAHVGVTPGIDFGPNGEGYLRFSYANSIDNINMGLDRIETYLSRL